MLKLQGVGLERQQFIKLSLEGLKLGCELFHHPGPEAGCQHYHQRGNHGNQGYNHMSRH